VELEFLIQNWHLFLALVVIIALLGLDPLRQRAGGMRPVSAIELPQLLNHEDAVVIDVCESAEYRNGHIPGAINMPMGQIADNTRKLEKYKRTNTPLVLACQTGNRSSKAAAILKKAEFTNLYTLSGGLAAWQKENLPVEKS
jgi:rhodanese-related sulfurtransferase